jgi:hypothetical protein
MNNEPVAWMSQGGDVSRSADYFVEMGFTDLIPLYTHPVKEEDGKVCARCGAIAYDPVITQTVKEQLTDEEIIAVGNAVVNHIDSNEGWIEFARAILRKAQEK